MVRLEGSVLIKMSRVNYFHSQVSIRLLDIVSMMKMYLIMCQPWKLFKDNMLDPLPIIVFNGEENGRYNEYATALNDERLSILNQFIMGERPLSEWDKAVEELHDIGMADYLDLVNSAYKRIYGK